MENIEERENGGTPPIIQTVRASLAFWVKEYIGYNEIEKREQLYINKALKRLVTNPNIKILGNLNAKRQAILSFLIYSTTNSCSSIDSSSQEHEWELNLWQEMGNQRGKPLHGPFVAALLNDLFGIQARGGCACAGPYGHELLNINKSQSLAIRSAVQEVKNHLISLTFFRFNLYEVKTFYFYSMYSWFLQITKLHGAFKAFKRKTKIVYCFGSFGTGLYWSKTWMDKS